MYNFGQSAGNLPTFFSESNVLVETSETKRDPRILLREDIVRVINSSLIPYSTYLACKAKVPCLLFGFDKVMEKVSLSKYTKYHYTFIYSKNRFYSSSTNIDEYKVKDDNIRSLKHVMPYYNVLKQGYSSLGYKHTKETKILLSELAKNRKHSEQTKALIARALTGENNPFYNKSHTMESKIRIMESKSSYPIICTIHMKSY